MKPTPALFVLGALLALTGCELLSTGSADEAAADQVFVQRLQYGVLPYAGFTGVIDTSIDSGTPTSTYNDDSALWVGKSGGDWRALFRFDLKCLEANSLRVTRATLTFVTSGTTEAGMPPVRAYAAPRLVTAYSTWSNFTTAGEELVPLSAERDIPKTQNWVTTIALDPAAVQSWIDDPTDNLGIVIAMPDQSTDFRYAVIYSSEEADISRRPYLTVYYSLD